MTIDPNEARKTTHSIDTATGEDAPAELSSKRVKQIFTDIAWKYERFNALSSFGRYRSWLRTLIDKSPITSQSRLLDIAGGTGDVAFTACAQKPPASIVLSDYTPAMLEVAQARLDAGEAKGVPVELAVVDGQDIPYEDESFDILTMSYGIRNMPERERALSEMYRVLKNWGFCSVTNLFYHTQPPKELLKKVSDIIGTEIKYTDEKYWLDIYTKSSQFEVYKFETKQLSDQTEETILNYIDFFMNKPHILALSEKQCEQIKERWYDILTVFNENHKYLSFIKCLLRKRAIPEEPELFKTKGNMYA